MTRPKGSLNKAGSIRAKVAELYRQGKTQKEVEELLCVEGSKPSRSTVRQYYYGLKRVINNPPQTEEQQ